MMMRTLLNPSIKEGAPPPMASPLSRRAKSLPRADEGAGPDAASPAASKPLARPHPPHSPLAACCASRHARLLLLSAVVMTWVAALLLHGAFFHHDDAAMSVLLFPSSSITSLPHDSVATQLLVASTSTGSTSASATAPVPPLAEPPPAQAVPRRALVTCAYDRRTLCQAYSQMRALRSLSSLEGGPGGPTPFLIFHADELYDTSAATTSSGAMGPHPELPWRPTVRRLVSDLRTYPDVHVLSLLPWLRTTYPHAFRPQEGGREGKEEQGDGEKEVARKYRGFMCKPAALLAGLDEGYDQVALLDLDAVLMHSPFDLTSTSAFSTTGAYLFRDRRITPAADERRAGGASSGSDAHDRQTTEGGDAGPPPPAAAAAAAAPGEGQEQGAEEPPVPVTLVANITRAWPRLHPNAAVVPPAQLMETDLFRGLTNEYGESAVVLWERSSRTDPATELLVRLVHPEHVDSWHFGYGDKEYYWLSFALTDADPPLPLAMSRYMPANVGRSSMVVVDRVRRGRASQTCSRGGMAQYIDDSDGRSDISTTIVSGGQHRRVPGRPRLFYLNGDDVEGVLQAADLEALEAAMDKLFIAPPSTVAEGQSGMCTFGGSPLTTEERGRLRDYFTPYHQCILRPSLRFEGEAAAASSSA